MHRKIITSQEIIISKIKYSDLNLLSEEGYCSKVFTAKDPQGKEVVLKVYPENKAAKARALRKNNHTGTVRDVSDTVFNEVQPLTQKYDFMMTYYGREKVYNSDRTSWRWIMACEKIPGISLARFVVENITDFSLIKSAAFALGAELQKWHAAGLAHGDGHLNNALIVAKEGLIKQVRLIDYNMIHHKNFHYCQEFGCFQPETNRFWEDIENDFDYIGCGFLKSFSEAFPLQQQEIKTSFMQGYEGI